LPGSLGGLLGLTQEERHYPLYRAGRTDVLLRFEVVMPEGYEHAVLTPPAVDWHYPADGGTVRTTSNYDEFTRTLKVEHRANLNPSVVGTELYDELLRMNRTLNHPAARTVLFERGDQ
jgi:hypothetical protein